MANQQAKRDDNWQPATQGETYDASRETRSLNLDPVTLRLRTTTVVSETALAEEVIIDNDDNSIAKEQDLPLIINENYVFSKTADNWVRWQATEDGYPFVRLIGIFDSAGHEVDINTSGQMLVTPYGPYDQFAQDASTEATTTIEYEHHEIHAGSSFWYDDVVTGSGVIDYLITTPDTTKFLHFGYEVESGGAGYTLELYEATNKGGTTLQTAYNRSRNIGTAPTATIHKGLTGGDTDGTRIMWHTSGTTTAGGKVGGSSKDATERVLLRNTKYIFRLTPLASNTISTRLNWYEHTDRN